MGGDWHLVQHIPTSVAHLIHSLVFCAPPCRAVRRTRVPWSSTRASTQAIRARRVGVGRPHGLYPPPTDPRIPHRVTQLRRERSLHPWKVTNSTRARAASALGFLCRSCGPSVRGRCVAPTRLEACSSDAAWASFRSPVGPAGACHSLGYGAAQGTCSFRLLARRVARVVHAEAARVRPEAVPHRSAVPGRRVGFRTDRRRYVSSFTVVRRWAGHTSGFGQGELCALCTPRPLGCAPRPSHTPALALAAASLICTSARTRRSL